MSAVRPRENTPRERERREKLHVRTREGFSNNDILHEGNGNFGRAFSPKLHRRVI